MHYYYRDKTITIVPPEERDVGALLTFNHPGSVTSIEQSLAEVVIHYLFPEGVIAEKKAPDNVESYELWYIAGKYMGAPKL